MSNDADIRLTRVVSDVSENFQFDANKSSSESNKEALKCDITKILTSSLEFCEGHNESLSDITSTISAFYPNASAIDIHHCLVKAFPDLQAQQSNDQNEVYYLGIKFSNSQSSAEERVIEWLKQRFVQDEFGSISSKTLVEMLSRELGSFRLNRLATYIRKAFPNAYLRRSDRVRWYCGFSLPEHEMTENERRGKLWLASACKWLKENITKDATKREKCSLIYSALANVVGRTGSNKYMAAVKATFPCVQKKVYNHNAYYEGIAFANDTLRNHFENFKVSNHSLSPKLLVTNETEKYIIDWLKSIVIKKDNHRERVIAFQHLLHKKLGYEITEKATLTHLRKAFIGLKYRKRDGIYYIYGYELRNPYRPKDTWMEKSISWARQVFEECHNSEVLHKLQPFIEIVKSGLDCSNSLKCCQLITTAFPNATISKSSEGRLIAGIKAKEGFDQVEKPDFDDEDFTGDFSHIDCDSIIEDRSNTVPSDGNLNDCSNESSNNSTALARLEEGMKSLKNANTCLLSHVGKLQEELQQKTEDTKILFDQLSKEMKSLRDDVAQSTRQRDTLIIQLQQSLMMLSQQQYQKLMQNQLLSTANIPPSNTQSSSQDIYDNNEHIMTMQALQNLHDNQIAK